MFKVLGFYKFFKVVSLKKNKKFINDLLIFNNIKGTIIISKEGLNGSIAGKPFKIKVVSAKIKKHFPWKISMINLFLWRIIMQFLVHLFFCLKAWSNFQNDSNFI